MTAEVIYRPETQDDFQEVFEINHKAFGQQNEAKLVNALRNNPNVFIPELSIVASKNNAIIGHILFTKINIKNDDKTLNESLAIAPMAVLPEFQKNGIGGQLIRRGLETAKQLGYQSVIVLGHEDYYPKFGFEPAEKWNIKAPFDVASNVFMAIELVKGSLENISGTVIYPKEFETV